MTKEVKRNPIEPIIFTFVNLRGSSCLVCVEIVGEVAREPQDLFAAENDNLAL